MAHHRVVRIVIRRLLLAVPLLFVVSILVFLLSSLAPGDGARSLLSETATPDQIAQLRHELGLDKPLYTRYGHWLVHALHGDFGASYTSHQTITFAIGQRLPVTLSLMVGALLVSLIGGVALGTLSAVRGGALGRLVDAFSMIGWIFPSFWLAAELIVIFSVKLRWLPTYGYVPITQSVPLWLKSLVLPVTALALGGIGALSKQTREAMLDVLSSEHIRMARANGIPERSIIFRHAFKNAAVRVVTVLGLLAVALLVGTVFVESVFNLPGLGSYIVSASNQRDLPVVQAVGVFLTLMVVAINLVVDLAYTWLNPKVQLR